MRPFVFIGGSCVLVAAAFACSSFSEAPTAPVDAGSEATTPDAASPAAFCAPSENQVFCNDFDIDASNPNAVLFPNPSRSIGNANEEGTISLVDIDGSVGGSAPHAASIALAKSDAGARNKVIIVDGLALDHVTCGFDLLVHGAPTSEQMGVFHIFPLSNDVSPRGADLEVVPANDGTFSVELHFDVGNDAISVGSITQGTFSHIEVSIAATGEVSASVENRPAARPLVASPEGGVRSVTFGIARAEAADILIDNIRCTK